MTATPGSVRVVLPGQLRALAGAAAEVVVTAGVPATQAGVLDALEARYPVLRGTIRDPATRRRRPFLRFFAAGTDISHQPPEDPLPAAVAAGEVPLIVVTAIAGG